MILALVFVYCGLNESIATCALNPQLLRMIHSNNRGSAQARNLKRINPKRLGDQIFNYLNLWNHPIPGK